jgi:hypothetical protein
VVIQTSLQLTVTVTCVPELDFLKQNWVMSADWSTLDSLPHSSLAQRYVSGLIQTSLQLTVTVTYDPELDFLKQNWVMSAEWSRLDSLPPFLCCTEICVRVITDISGIVRLRLTVTVTFDPELDFLKQNWVMSAEWSARDSLPPLLCCTEICVRVNTDISAINLYVYI